MISQRTKPRPGPFALLMPWSSIVAVTLISIAGVGCSSTGKTTNQSRTLSTVVYEGWWSDILAEGEANRACPPETRQRCKAENRAKADEYADKLAAAFTSDSQCSGLKLLVFKGTDRSSRETLNAYDELFNKPHWELQVDFSSGLQELPWMLHVESISTGRSASGEGDAHTIAHSTCSAVKSQVDLLAH